MQQGCGTGQCGCAEAMPTVVADGGVATAAVNGVALHRLGDRPDDDQLRQRAHSELLRQEAIRVGLLAPDDVVTVDGIQSEAASDAIERLLSQTLVLPTPDEAAGRRYLKSNPARFQHGERVHARHILFAVTPGTNVVALRNRAEAALLEARCRDAEAPTKFVALAAELSNCPSGANGGDLGWLTEDACAPEFAREIFGHTDVGVLPRLVHSRFGLHVVEVLAREAGAPQTFTAVRGAVEQALQQQSYITAVRQYLQLLAAEARIDGVQLDCADSPLVQ